MHYDLLARNSKLRVSVLCPGWAKTHIMSSERNRPAAQFGTPLSLDAAASSPSLIEFYEWAIRGLANGSEPEEIADTVFEGVARQDLYLLPHPNWNPAIQYRLDHILSGEIPDHDVMKLAPSDGN